MAEVVRVDPTTRRRSTYQDLLEAVLGVARFPRKGMRQGKTTSAPQYRLGDLRVGPEAARSPRKRRRRAYPGAPSRQQGRGRDHHRDS